MATVEDILLLIHGLTSFEQNELRAILLENRIRASDIEQLMWRHKILDALQTIAKQTSLEGIIEADETFFALSFKGNHKRTRHSQCQGIVTNEGSFGTTRLTLAADR